MIILEVKDDVKNIMDLTSAILDAHYNTENSDGQIYIKSKRNKEFLTELESDYKMLMTPISFKRPKELEGKSIATYKGPQGITIYFDITPEEGALTFREYRLRENIILLIDTAQVPNSISLESFADSLDRIHVIEHK